MKRVQHGALPGAVDADQEVPGETQAMHGPAARPAGVQVQNAQRHRQALAAVNHPHQVGVLDIVIGEFVSTVAKAGSHGFGQRGDAVIVGCVIGNGDGAGQFRQMIAVAVERNLRPVQRGQRQRRLGQIDLVVVLPADLLQIGGKRLAIVNRHGQAGDFLRRGSSFSMTWLTTRRTLVSARA